MVHTQSRIIVSEGPCEAHGLHHTCVHHRDVPENWAQGASADAAARQLIQMFERERDCVSSDRHREVIDRVIADIRAFLEEFEWTADAGPGDP